MGGVGSAAGARDLLIHPTYSTSSDDVHVIGRPVADFVLRTLCCGLCVADFGRRPCSSRQI